MSKDTNTGIWLKTTEVYRITFLLHLSFYVIWATAYEICISIQQLSKAQYVGGSKLLF